MSHLTSGGKERTSNKECLELTVESRKFDVVQMDGGLMDSACSQERRGKIHERKLKDVLPGAYSGLVES